jgi:hypothetical protein
MPKRNTWLNSQNDDVKRMVRALKRQFGEDWQSTLEDISNHGADAGVSGFIYYHETGKFYAKHSKAIWDLLYESAQNAGVTAIGLVATFKIAPQIQDSETFENALVWFALEDVAFHLVNNED